MAEDPNSCCGEVHEIANAHLHEVDDKIARLTALRDELQAMVACDNRRIADCRIIEVLATTGSASITVTERTPAPQKWAL